MITNDPIADMLTRIRNALLVGKRTVDVRRTGVCIGIAKVLLAEGYIEGFDSIDDATKQGFLRVQLKYSADGQRVINAIDRVSTPGCRRYFGVEEIPRIMGGMGISILSTNKGVLSDRKARAEKVGGELLCTVS